METIKIWDGISEINGVSAEEILSTREDLKRALGDIFLVLDSSGDTVKEIQIGKVIAANYGFESGLSLQEIAELYLAKKIEEEAELKLEIMTNIELQEEVALLSYEVMMLQEVRHGIAMASKSTKGEKQHSPKFELIRKWYSRGFWTEDMIINAVEKNVITAEEAEEIIG